MFKPAKKYWCGYCLRLKETQEDQEGINVCDECREVSKEKDYDILDSVEEDLKYSHRYGD